MTWAEFKKTWSRYTGKESSAYQSHFNDLCRLLGHPSTGDEVRMRVPSTRGRVLHTMRHGGKPCRLPRPTTDAEAGRRAEATPTFPIIIRVDLCNSRRSQEIRVIREFRG